MTIKDVETLLGIPKATIRFYEKEGLLQPKRTENTYREYTDEDIALLKKIIVLRKIGISVSDIKSLLKHDAAMQEILLENTLHLQEQMRELEGAMKICKLMQKNNEDMDSFNTQYYWDEIHNEECAGNRFLEIATDVMDFEKSVIWEEFGIADEDGNLKVSPLKAVIISLCMCTGVGLLWFFLDGMQKEAFVEGFFFPFICIIITSIFGLPVHFIEKKNANFANMLKKIGTGICVLITIALLILVIFVEV